MMPPTMAPTGAGEDDCAIGAVESVGAYGTIAEDRVVRPLAVAEIVTLDVTGRATTLKER
jgi:hypothetical protein